MTTHLGPLGKPSVDDLFDDAPTTVYKVALLTPNVANMIAAHLRQRCPALCDIPGLWFSGSNVWKHLYGLTPDPASDIDIFAPDLDGDDPPAGWVADAKLRFGWTVQPTITDKVLAALGTRTKMAKTRPCSGVAGDKYKEGARFQTDIGQVDMWSAKSPSEALRDYPTASHAHCRAAFSFTEGLVVLPNEKAQ